MRHAQRLEDVCLRVFLGLGAGQALQQQLRGADAAAVGPAFAGLVEQRHGAFVQEPVGLVLFVDGGAPLLVQWGCERADPGTVQQEVADGDVFGSGM